MQGLRIQSCLLMQYVLMEEDVGAGSSSASSRQVSQRGSLAVSTGLQVDVFYKAPATTSSHSMLCLIFTYAVVSGRMIQFVPWWRITCKVLMWLLNWKTHSLNPVSHVPSGLGAAECPKLILNLLGIKGTQPQRLCWDGVRWVYFGGVSVWQPSVVAFIARSTLPSDCN